MSKLEVIVGGMYGSCAKGNVAGFLSRGRDQLAAVRVAGPNAGHSVYDVFGRCWKLQQVPVAAVTNKQASLFIAAGSEIDMEILQREVTQLDDAGFAVSSRLFVDSEATIVEKHHGETEYGDGVSHGEGGLTKSIGPTGKGVGAARAARCMRTAKLFRDAAPPHQPSDTAKMLREFSALGDVMIEGTQGYALGTHSGAYPWCTSSDCRAIDFCSMVGISPWTFSEVEVWVVLRTYPIRVAGNSGPMRNELTWDELSRRTNGYIQPERTTVTNKVRRVGDWDPILAREAIEANGGSDNVKVALMFFDYWMPGLAGKEKQDDLTDEHWRKVLDVENELGVDVSLLGTSPSTIIDLR